MSHGTKFQYLIDVSSSSFPDFGWQRIVSRALVMISVVFVAESVPNFGVLLDLVGGSTITMMALVLPIIFNLSLTTIRKKRENKEDEEKISIKEVFQNSDKIKLLANILILGMFKTSRY